MYEARNIARFSQESGIVDVRDYFEENDTAYIIMEYIEGKNLKVYLHEFGVFNVQALLTLFKPVFDALEKIHKVGLIHRDISPDNIMFTKTSALKLMDFGASTNFDEGNISRGAIVLKPGYAPLEQYDRNGNQGPWTDIYALCATIYKCITGITPDEATVREKKDDLKKPSELGVIIPIEVENALMKGLALNVSDRFINISEIKENLYRAEIAYSDVDSGNKELYIDDDFETVVIDEKFIFDEEKTALLSDEQETILLEDEQETVVLEEDNKQEPFVQQNETPYNSSCVIENKENNSFNKKLLFGIIGSVLLTALIVALVVIVVNINKPLNSSYEKNDINGYHKKVVDEADLLSDYEESELTSKLNRISEETNLDIVVAIVYSLDGKTSTEYADDFYDYNGYGYGTDNDGVLLLVSTEHRDWAISTCGYAINIFTDDILEQMKNEILPKFSEDNYYEGFDTYADLCEDFVMN